MFSKGSLGYIGHRHESQVRDLTPDKSRVYSKVMDCYPTLNATARIYAHFYWSDRR